MLNVSSITLRIAPIHLRCTKSMVETDEPICSFQSISSVKASLVHTKVFFPYFFFILLLTDKMTLFASPFVSCQSRVVVRFVVFLLFGICWVLLVGISIVFFTTVGCFRSLSGSFHVSHRRTFLLYMSRSIPSDRETMCPEKKKNY